MVIDARQLTKSYLQSDSRLEVLKGVTFQVEEGEFVAVVGPSGAGKSTLLHIIGGLDKPSSGNVTVDGEDIYRLGDKARAKIRNQKIGFIFQFYHLLPEFSALENVLLPAMVCGRDTDISLLKARAGELLGKVGLSHRLEHRPSELSGGEQQRVAIARSLMNDPKILLCDEPTGNLDSGSGEEIIDLLADLNRNKKITLIIVTHDSGIARRAQKVVMMKDGRFIDGRGRADYHNNNNDELKDEVKCV
jgi:lipoprotein-releasing system ATP-binding protein